MSDVVPLRLAGERIEALDQTLLPHVERYIELDGLDTVCEAIRSLRVRGAPLLGLVGAYGMWIAARERGTSDAVLGEAAKALMATRPTAVDLGTMVQRSLGAALAIPDEHGDRMVVLRKAADALAERREREDRAMGLLGCELIPSGGAVLTHCNAGPLATGGGGTALGVVKAAWDAGRLSECFATETRPLLQGARLTAWELKTWGIPATLVPDTAAAALIASGKVSAVVTGADRIAANGDTANKIGTYGLALAAARTGVPFIVVAPTSTIDVACPDGAGIPIEMRDGREVGGFGGVRWAPEGVGAYNPAFDVTPADLIGAIVTERGVARAPYSASIAGLMRPVDGEPID